MSPTGNHVAAVRFRAGIGGEPVVVETRRSSAHGFDSTPWGAALVASEDHPVAGDHFGLKVNVGVGCCAEVRSFSPAVARPGQPGTTAISTTRVTANVASDALLAWALDAGQAAGGSDHRTTASVQLAGNSRLLWRDEFRTERRADVRPGTWRSRLRITRDSWPVISSELAVGPGAPLWESPSVVGGAWALSSMVVIDPGHPAQAWTSARATAGAAAALALPLASPGIRILAWGEDLASCRSAIQKLIPAAGIPAWAAMRWNVNRAPAVPVSPGLARSI